METISRSMTSVDFSSLQPDGTFWRTQNHFLRMIPTATASNTRFKNTLAAYQEKGIPIDSVQAPNQLWYTVEPCGPIPLAKIYLDLDYELRIYIWLSLAKSINQYHSSQASYGRCHNPQVTLGFDGKVFLHGCILEKNNSRSDEVVQFSQFLSKLITQPCDGISLKQQNQLAASSLMVVLNEGCAGNLKSYNGVQTLLRSIELLLPSTAEVLQRRLAHALSNESLKSHSNRLSIQLDQLIRQRKYPQLTLVQKRPSNTRTKPKQSIPSSTPQITEQSPSKTPSVPPIARIKSDPERQNPNGQPESAKQQHRLPVDTQSTARPIDNFVPSNGSSKKSVSTKIHFEDHQVVNQRNGNHRKIIFASLVPLAMLAAVLLWPTSSSPPNGNPNPSDKPRTSNAAQTAIRTEATLPAPADINGDPESPSVVESPTQQITEQTATSNARGTSTSPPRTRRTTRKNRVAKRQRNTEPSLSTETPILPVQPSGIDTESTQPETNFGLVQKSKKSQFQQIAEASWRDKALQGQFTDEEIIFLRSIPSSDPYFNASQTLILMHAQSNNDPLLMKLVLNTLMSNPENQSDPYLLLSSAHLALNEAKYPEAIQLLKASQNSQWPEQNNAFIGQWLELYANALTGHFLNGTSQLSLDEITQSWDKAYGHAQIHGQSERVLRIQLNLDRLEGSVP